MPNARNDATWREVFPRITPRYPPVSGRISEPVSGWSVETIPITTIQMEVFRNISFHRGRLRVGRWLNIIKAITVQQAIIAQEYP